MGRDPLDFLLLSGYLRLVPGVSSAEEGEENIPPLSLPSPSPSLIYGDDAPDDAVPTGYIKAEKTHERREVDSD